MTTITRFLRDWCAWATSQPPAFHAISAGLVLLGWALLWWLV